MRTLTAGETQILNLHNKANHLKVSIYANTQWYDMTNLEGYNWVISYNQSRSVDDTVSGADIVLWKKIFSLNLATFVDGSKINANGTIVDVPNLIKVETATVGENVQPASGDWNQVFYGRIEEVNWAQDKVQLKCLDKSTDLQQTFIETQQIYGPPDNDPTNYLEEFLQDILDDNSTGFALYSPNGTSLGGEYAGGDTTAWSVGKWKQGKETVLSALKRLAQSIGWEVRYKWHNDSTTPEDSAFQLVMDAPDRATAARGTITITGDISATDTFVINSTTFTCVAGTPSDDEFNNSPSDTAATAQNIVNMLRDSGCSEVDNIEAWRVGSTVIIEWRIPGVVGNSVTFTESLTNTTIDGSSVLGGTRTGAAVDTTPDWTFDNTDYQNIDHCSISRADVRNVVRVTYWFKDENDAFNRITTYRENAASIAKYGRKYMEITEASNSLIDTTGEASDLTIACLEDLKEPIAQISVELPYFWAMELNDMIKLTADNDHFDSDQTLAVVSIEDNFAQDRATTTIKLRGQPSGGTRRWMEVEGRPGVAPGQDLYQDAKPSTSASVGISTIIVTSDDPRIAEPPVDDWAYTECHVSTVSGFTPSASTLVATGRQTRFEINGLIPGTTYYVKLVMYDNAGNAAVTTTEVFETTQKVAPYHEDEDREHGVLLLNGDFGSQTLPVASNEPDYWEVITGTWGNSSDFYIDTTIAKTGGRSLFGRATTTSNTVIESEFIPVKSDRIYACNWVWYLTNSFGNNNGVSGNSIYIYRYDKDKGYLSSAPIESFVRKWWTSADYADSTWHSMTVPGIVFASNVRYVKIRVQKNYHTATFSAYFDRIVFREIPPSFKAIASSQSSVSGSGWTTLNVSASQPYSSTGVSHDHGSDFDNTNDYFTVPRNGLYQFMSASNISVSCNMQLRFRVNTGGGFGTLETSQWFTPISSSVYGVHQSSPVMLNAGDLIEAQVYHDNGSPLTVNDIIFAGRKIDKE